MRLSFAHRSRPDICHGSAKLLQTDRRSPPAHEWTNAKFARLERLSAEVTRGSGGVDGLFGVSAGGTWLQIGRTVELTVNLPAEPGTVAVPSQALYGNRHLYRIVDGRMRRIDVNRVGEFDTPDGRRVLVRSSELATGDRVIVTQLPNAVEGLKVRVES